MRSLGIFLTILLAFVDSTLVFAMHGDDAQRAEVGAGARPFTIENLSRPSILISAENLERLRADAAPGGWKRSLYENGPKAVADAWADRSVTIPARAGHYHHFFCSDGTMLALDEAKTTDGLRTFVCPGCGKSYTDERYEAAYRYQEHVERIEACRSLALAWGVEREKRYARKAAEILVKYADAYPGRHTKHAGDDAGGMFYQSLGESMYIIPLAQAYDLICDADVLSKEDKEHLEYDLFWECAEGLTKMGAGGNWGSWHLSAVGVIGLATRHQRFLDYGLKQFKHQINDELGEDGLWPESVHTYHFFPFGAFLYFTEAAWNAGIDLYNWTSPKVKSIRSMFTAPLSYMYPDFRLPAINDGWYETYLPSEHYRVGWERYGDPTMAWAARETEPLIGKIPHGWQISDHLWTLAIGHPIPRDLPRPVFESIDFPVLGICTLRERREAGEVMVTFDYGPYLGHGQPDKMGITLWANGRLLIPDYGTPGYGSAILGYYRSTAGHNTILVGGQDQKNTKERRLLLFERAPELQVAVAETSEAYPGIEWRRTVILRSGRVLIVDDLASESEHTYDFVLRCEAEDFSVNSGAETSGVDFVHPHISAQGRWEPIEDQFAGRWANGDRTGVGLAATGTGLSVFTGRCPADTGTRTVPAVVFEQQNTETRFVTLLEPFTDGEKPLNTVRILSDDAIAVGADHFGIREDAFRWTSRDEGSQPRERTWSIPQE